MLLIGTYLSPFARRVAAALVSRGVRFDHEDLNGYADPHRARALNPVGKVPVLHLDNGECLIDSSAILDHLNEYLPPSLALLPPSGRERREVLRLAAIATTIYERSTVCFIEGLEPAAARRQNVIDAHRLSIIGGLRALDRASEPGGQLGRQPLSLAGLSAIIAREYLAIAMPDLSVIAAAPALAALADSLANEDAFAKTRPVVKAEA
jgi:glutathione S-transferase